MSVRRAAETYGVPKAH